jgi:hypothetical protein
MEATVEHRKHQRFLVRFNSYVSTDDVRIEPGLVLDLSLAGCRLMSATHVPAGIPIAIHIRPDEHSPIDVPSAVVRWIGASAFGV